MLSRGSAIALAGFLFLGACGDGTDEGFELGPDSGGFVDVPDAGSPFADASAPAIDASPTGDNGGSPFPFPTGDGGIGLACELDELEPLFECVSDNCLDSLSGGGGTSDLLTCVTFSCGLQLLTLPPDCAQCILGGLTDPSNLLDACVDGLPGGGGSGGGFPFPTP